MLRLPTRRSKSRQELQRRPAVPAGRSAALREQQLRRPAQHHADQGKVASVQEAAPQALLRLPRRVALRSAGLVGSRWVAESTAGVALDSGLPAANIPAYLEIHDAPGEVHGPGGRGGQRKLQVWAPWGVGGELSKGLLLYSTKQGAVGALIQSARHYRRPQYHHSTAPAPAAGAHPDTRRQEQRQEAGQVFDTVHGAPLDAIELALIRVACGAWGKKN